MKKIIIGQVMLWLNIAAILLGYKLVTHFYFNEYINGLCGFIGVLSSGFNMVMSAFVQIKGYEEQNIINT